MSRTAANTGLTMVRGSSWEDYLDYYEDDGVTPIDLDGYSAVLQVWALEDLYGTGTTPLLQLTSADAQLVIEAIAGSGSTAKNRVRIAVIDPADHATLNPDNAKKAVYGFGVRLTDAGPPDYVLPFAKGKLTCQGTEVH